MDGGVAVVGHRGGGQDGALLRDAADGNARRRRRKDSRPNEGRAVELGPGRRECVGEGLRPVVEQFERGGDGLAACRVVGEVELNLGVVRDLLRGERLALKHYARASHQIGLVEIDPGAPGAISVNKQLHHLGVR